MPMESLLLEIALPVPLARAFSYRFTPDGPEAVLPVRGDLVVVPFGRRRRVIGLVVSVKPLAPGVTTVDGVALKDVAEVLDPAYRLGPVRMDVARWMSDYYALPLGEVVPLFHPPAPGTRARPRRSPADPAYPDVDPANIRPTPHQKRPIDRAIRLLSAREFGAILLHGVTGSGKTEVYLAVIAAALARGLGAIYLLPEIALTPQTLARIKARFGDQVAAIHSGLSAGERCRVHEGAARGEIKVVVGPRSALFAPVRELGVIVVDEEHDSSYKQDEKPRYHARHVALVRGRGCQAVVILGSATPDLETVVRAREGVFDLCPLPERQGAGLPEVQVVDMRGTTVREGFTDELLTAMASQLEAGRQSLLFYNRRGFARVMQCSDCGEAVTCPNCDIAMTLHLRPRRLLCHYCGHTQPAGQSCPDCGSDAFLPSGGGTEKVELNLLAQFPSARVMRLDHDTTRRRGSYHRILTAFANHEADILVGTQMVAKGHHFPHVGLVGVLAADDGLAMPDFRAGERTFQLLTQVAGRAGRTGPGSVIFQTWRPEDPVILAAAAHDPERFLALELPVREALGYPPYRRLARIGLLGRRMAATREAAEALAEVLRAQLPGGNLQILGPAPGVFERLQDRYRFQILIKGDLTRKQKSWVAQCLRELKAAYKGLDAYLDIDPVAVF